MSWTQDGITALELSQYHDSTMSVDCTALVRKHYHGNYKYELVQPHASTALGGDQGLLTGIFSLPQSPFLFYKKALKEGWKRSWFVGLCV